MHLVETTSLPMASDSTTFSYAWELVQELNLPLQALLALDPTVLPSTRQRISQRGFAPTFASHVVSFLLEGIGAQ